MNLKCKAILLLEFIRVFLFKHTVLHILHKCLVTHINVNSLNIVRILIFKEIS
jgi:hypothetical protein